MPGARYDAPDLPLDSVRSLEEYLAMQRGADSLYSYITANSLGEAVMTHGVAERICEERELLERYG